MPSFPAKLLGFIILALKHILLFLFYVLRAVDIFQGGESASLAGKKARNQLCTSCALTISFPVAISKQDVTSCMYDCTSSAIFYNLSIKRSHSNFCTIMQYAPVYSHKKTGQNQQIFFIQQFQLLMFQHYTSYSVAP